MQPSKRTQPSQTLISLTCVFDNAIPEQGLSTKDGAPPVPPPSLFLFLFLFLFFFYLGFLLSTSVFIYFEDGKTHGQIYRRRPATTLLLETNLGVTRAFFKDIIESRITAATKITTGAGALGLDSRDWRKSSLATEKRAFLILFLQMHPKIYFES